MTPDAALVAALLRDGSFRSCIERSGEEISSAYVAGDFHFRSLTLASGPRLVIAVGKDGCGWQGQAARVLIYERAQGGYRLVLSSVSLPERVAATPDGTLNLAAHETANAIVQATYVWNGARYAFSPEHSSIYCVGPQRDNERPYDLPIHFARGTSSIVLRGTAFENCGQDYSFVARAGQRVTIERLTPEPPGLRIPIFLDFRDDSIADVSGLRWSGTLRRSGRYTLNVFGTDQRGDVGLQPFTIRLTIR
ncbi:MAG: hypothetical protein JO190_05810 [Candidatus Eremiobacteraeota bacterium]|nr:hypothetical protein [Candidatus Eremiobacteraeota bacterium]